MPESVNHNTYKEHKKYLLAVRLSILVSGVFTILTFAHMQGILSNAIMMSTVALSSIASLIYVLKTKNYIPVLYIISASGVILPSLSIIFLNELTHYTEWIWMCCAILLAFLGTNTVYGFLLVFITIASSSYFVYFGVNNNIELTTERNTIQLIALNIEFIGAFGCGAYLLYLFHDFYTRSDSELMLINANLTEKNNKIMQQDEEKTILVKEIHHRVKNNLQIITSLLRMQSNEVNNNETKKQFNDAINRVMAMSLIHQKLYQENTLAQIELKNYLNQLINELLNTYNLEKEVKSNVIVEVSKIGLKSIVPIGLLLNELVSNSLEHGFKNDSKGEIHILVREEGDDILLTYSDNGTWKDIANSNKSNFGLELIELLTEQLEGSKDFSSNENGTFYNFRLKNLDH